MHKEHSTDTRSSHQEVDDGAHRDYVRPIRSKEVITDDYDRENNNNNKVNEVKEGGFLVLDYG